MPNHPISDTASGSRNGGQSAWRLRELPPFGDPDEPYPPPELAPEVADDPRGVYLPPAEETAKAP